MKICLFAVGLFRSDRRTDGRIDMMKLTAAFRNFAKEPKQCLSNARRLAGFILLTISRLCLLSRGTCVNRPTSCTVFLISTPCDSSVNIGECLTGWKRVESVSICAPKLTFPLVKRPGLKTEQTSPCV